jgi:UDP-2,3-diacylglucosamine pyrophosphatase LpxH
MLYCIADLHLCDNGPRDMFNINPHRDKELLSFCDFVGDDELVILGDLFEFWKANISVVLECRKSLLDRLAKMNVIYVHGNHDIDIINSDQFNHPLFRKTSPPLTRIINGKSFKFMHGHEFDTANASLNPGWGRWLTILAGLYEDANGSPLLSDGSSIEERMLTFGNKAWIVWHYISDAWRKLHGQKIIGPLQLSPSQDARRLGQHLDRIYSDKLHCGYDYAVVGHTHLQGRYPGINDWYYNCGSWVWSKNQFLSIDNLGVVKQWEWTGTKSVEKNNVIKIRT